MFKKTKEDFICEKCGYAVMGTGYTNHCPKCLWSKHVDIHPGDRAAECGGMMEPVAVELDGEETILVHKCLKCGHNKRNKVQKEDDYDKVIAITAKMAEGK